jgi:hypothetical protein
MKSVLIVVGVVLVAELAMPAAAKDITQNIHWSIQRSELSISRVRVTVGPKVANAACKYYGSVLKSGGTVHVNIIGAGGERITSFHVTKAQCR